MIREEKRSEVMWYVSKIADPTRRKAYEQVFDETCVPWYVVAIIHGMECSFDMNSHLHNGDSIKAKTKQVPAGRPNPWLPPSDWVSSAVDALKYDMLHEQADWSLPRILYRWEGYNGAGAAACCTTSTRRISGASRTTTRRASSSPTTCGT